jgi:hypothetical protein
MHSKSYSSPRAMRKNYCAILFLCFFFFFFLFTLTNKNKMMALHKPYEILYYDLSLNGFNSSIIEIARRILLSLIAILSLSCAHWRKKLIELMKNTRRRSIPFDSLFCFMVESHGNPLETVESAQQKCAHSGTS